MQLDEPQDKSIRAFHVKNEMTLMDCFRMVWWLYKNHKHVYVQIVSRERFKFIETRKAYFAFIRDEIYSSAENNGLSVAEIHEKLKAKFLLRIMCRENTEFADLVLRETKDGVTQPIIIKLLSVADSSLTTTAMLQEHFQAVQDFIAEKGIAELLE